MRALRSNQTTILVEHHLGAFVEAVGQRAVELLGVCGVEPGGVEGHVVAATRRHIDDQRFTGLEPAATDQPLGQCIVAQQVGGERVFAPFRGEGVRVVQQPDVVDQHVDLASAGQQLPHQAFGVGLQREVAHHGMDAVDAHLLAIGHHLRQFRCVACRYGHGCSRARGLQRDVPAKPARGTGHQPVLA